MNQTILSGHLTADIESRSLQDKTLAKFTLACNQGERTVFMPVEAWNQDHLPTYIGKGSKVLISGSLKQEQWTTEQGEKRSRIVLVAHQVEFLDPPSGQRGEAMASPTAPVRSTRPASPQGHRTAPRPNRPARHQAA